MHMREGSFRHRAKRTEVLTQKLRDHRTKKLALQTQEALQQFEDKLNAEQDAMSKAFDDIPTEASRLRSSRTGSQQLFSSRNSLNKSQSEPIIPASARLDSSIERDTRTKKPPSPLTFHQYGSISPKSTTSYTQHRRRLGEPERSPFRQTTIGFYFPNSTSRQGAYGDKLLDPCLMPQLSWAPPIEGQSERCFGDAGDVRPLAARELQIGRHLPRSGHPTSDIVRSNVAHKTKAKRVIETMHKRREEAVIEHAQFESGVFDGHWRDPLLDVGGHFRDLYHNVPEPGPAEDHSWLFDASVCFLAGTPQELDVSEAQLNAVGMLTGLDRLLRRARSTLHALFAAENMAGPKGQLEPDQFLRGLTRLGVMKDSLYSTENLCEAMAAIDPCFDGRISLPVIGRALKVVRLVTNPHDESGRSPSKLPGVSERSFSKSSFYSTDSGWRSPSRSDAGFRNSAWGSKDSFFSPSKTDAGFSRSDFGPVDLAMSGGSFDLSQSASGASLLPVAESPQSPTMSMRLEIGEPSIARFQQTFEKFKEQQAELTKEHQRMTGPG
eukprot:TRINITY_DN47960_c0_g1_i1.p1 TRINITY_DN47960_c0_g1~~TRINITY_DN47960_c0_g1_i1.p1  ORF type:complete len:561 (+),score=76.70 TRINITY_DN47960_c0_g1_i1:33-1685(+)